jgi:hypothetical protein
VQGGSSAVAIVTPGGCSGPGQQQTFSIIGAAGAGPASEFYDGPKSPRRAGTMTIAGQTVTLSQDGVSAHSAIDVRGERRPLRQRADFGGRS